MTYITNQIEEAAVIMTHVEKVHGYTPLIELYPQVNEQNKKIKQAGKVMFNFHIETSEEKAEEAIKSYLKKEEVFTVFEYVANWRGLQARTHTESNKHR